MKGLFVITGDLNKSLAVAEEIFLLVYTTNNFICGKITRKGYCFVDCTKLHHIVFIYESRYYITTNIYTTTFFDLAIVCFDVQLIMRISNIL